MRTVLIVHDDPILRRAMRRELQREFGVLEAGSPEGGRTILDRIALDAVLTDLEIAGNQGAGLIFLAEVRERWPACARVLLSGDFTAGTSTSRLDVAQRVIAKPWEAKALLNALRALLP